MSDALSTLKVCKRLVRLVLISNRKCCYGADGFEIAVEGGADGADERASGWRYGKAVVGAGNEAVGVGGDEVFSDLNDRSGGVAVARDKRGLRKVHLAHQLFDGGSTGAIVVCQDNAANGCKA